MYVYGNVIVANTPINYDDIDALCFMAMIAGFNARSNLNANIAMLAAFKRFNIIAPVLATLTNNFARTVIMAACDFISH